MKYSFILSIMLISCGTVNQTKPISNKTLTESDQFIQGNYSHYFGKTAMVSHHKVYEFSARGECFVSGNPIGPDSHSNGPDYYGKYTIRNDTLHAHFYMRRAFASIQNRKDYLTKNGDWEMINVKAFNIYFYLQSKDSIVELSSNTIFNLKHDTLSFLPIISSSM